MRRFWHTCSHYNVCMFQLMCRVKARCVNCHFLIYFILKMCVSVSDRRCKSSMMYILNSVFLSPPFSIPSHCHLLSPCRCQHLLAAVWAVWPLWPPLAVTLTPPTGLFHIQFRLESGLLFNLIVSLFVKMGFFFFLNYTCLSPHKVKLHH